jgi:integral membrane sensor domain MASE1/two-component sensor histidine kinase
VLLTGIYVLAGKLGLSLAIVHPSASAVWAPTGIALAALLLLGYRVWPAIFVGAFLVNVTTAGSVATSLGIALGNTLEGIVGAYLVNRFANGPGPFDRPQDAFRFALLAGMVSTAASATIGVTSLTVGGYGRWADFWPTWMTWWLGDLGGALVVAPLLLLWIRDPRPRWTRAQVIEAAALLMALLVVGQVVFSWSFPAGSKGHPLAFLCMPLLVWAAFRFDQRVASAAIVVLSAIAIRGTLAGTAPPERLELNVSLVLLQVFMGAASLTALVLAAVVAEQRRVEGEVRATSGELRGAVTDLEAFSHSISHDLRSPVGAVLNYTSIIEESHGGQLGDEGLRLLRRIRASAESATGLLDQLVLYTSVGHRKGEMRQIDMTSLAREVQREIVEGGDEVGHVHFELSELPPAWGSSPLLRCVFRNLFSNAVKYTRGRTERRIEVCGTAGVLENTYSVIDNGIGFQPEHGVALFQPFRRLAGAQPFEGAGLGLAIVARIIRKHRGQVWAESDGSMGARFSFTLPRGENGA